MSRTRFLTLATALVGLLAAAPASAGPVYSFTNITHNDDTNALIGQSQLFLEVSPDGGNVRFRFFNTGPLASSICNVYFEDGALLGIANIVNGPGVRFSAPASPPNLPGGASVRPAFVTTPGFSADADPPVQPNGVNPAEHLAIVFALQPGRTYADVLDDLAAATLRVGIHVQGFATGGSESFVQNPCPIPAPGALALAGLGAGVLGIRRPGSGGPGRWGARDPAPPPPRRTAGRLSWNWSSAKWRLGLLWEGKISFFDFSFPNHNHGRENAWP